MIYSFLYEKTPNKTDILINMVQDDQLYKAVEFHGTLSQVTFPLYACTVAYTEQVIIYKVYGRTRSCLYARGTNKELVRGSIIVLFKHISKLWRIFVVAALLNFF